jgi:hypothetical protein
MEWGNVFASKSVATKVLAADADLPNRKLTALSTT